MDARQPAPVQPVVDAHVGAHRAHGLGYGHVLPPSLVAGGAQGQQLGAGQALAAVVGVVVFHLVVVPHHQPRRVGMGGLKGRIALVERIPLAEVGQVAHQGLAVRAHGVLGRGVLVDVVAHEDHQIGLARGGVAPGRPVTSVPALAAGQHRAQGGGCIGRRRGAGAAHRAALAQSAEAVEVAAPGRQAGGLGMHAVGVGGHGHLGAARNHLGAGLVVGQHPVDWHLVGQGRAGQAGPQHQAGALGLARGDAQCKAEFVGSAGMAHKGRCGQTGGAQGKQVAAAQGHGVLTKAGGSAAAGRCRGPVCTGPPLSSAALMTTPPWPTPPLP